jgi:hypothetical protein
MSDEIEGAPDTDKTPEDAFIDALDRGDAKRAGAILRGLDRLTKRVCEALADMLDGDPAKDENLVRIYPLRLVFAPWPITGRPRRTFIDHFDDIDLARRVRRLVKKNGMSISAASEKVGAECQPKLSGSTLEKAYHRVKKRMLFWSKQ